MNRTNKMTVPAFLPLLLLQLAITVDSKLNSFQVTSYRKSRAGEDGPVRCAMDNANMTMSSSSLENCSLYCARNDTCSGFNIKNSLTTCDVYNYRPKFTFADADCTFYQVNIDWRSAQRVNLYSLFYRVSIRQCICCIFFFSLTWSGN